MIHLQLPEGISYYGHAKATHGALGDIQFRSTIDSQTHTPQHLSHIDSASYSSRTHVRALPYQGRPADRDLKYARFLTCKPYAYYQMIALQQALQKRGFEDQEHSMQRGSELLFTAARAPTTNPEGKAGFSGSPLQPTNAVGSKAATASCVGHSVSPYSWRF